MDCYIASLYKLLGSVGLSEEAFVFLSNYSITKCWWDKEAARSFSVPVVFPCRFGNLEDLQSLFPNLKESEFTNFESYLDFLRQRTSKGEVVIAVDRYYLEYIEPKKHMGAHYLLVKEVKNNSIFYYDPYDGKIHMMTLELLRKATEKQKVSIQYMGRIVLHLSEIPSLMILDHNSLERILKARVNYLSEAIEEMKTFKEFDSDNVRVFRFFLKVALGGMQTSDFYGKNGRKENYVFLKKLKLRFPSFCAKILLEFYSFLAIFFSYLYKREQTKESTWLKYITIYILILKIERIFYEHLSKRSPKLSTRLFWHDKLERDNSEDS